MKLKDQERSSSKSVGKNSLKEEESWFLDAENMSSSESSENKRAYSVRYSLRFRVNFGIRLGLANAIL
jgi:hypothetical protein